MVARTLSLKQQRFIEEFLLDGNVTASAKRAGYSVKSARVTGQETMSNPAVRASLQARQAAEAARHQLSRAKAVNGILEAVEMAKLQCNPMAMVRGWAEIGKMLNFYAPDELRVEVMKERGSLAVDFSRMSDAELIKRIGEAATG